MEKYLIYFLCGIAILTILGILSVPIRIWLFPDSVPWLVHCKETVTVYITDRGRVDSVNPGETIYQMDKRCKE